MKVKSYGGNSFGADYTAVLREATAIMLPAVRAVMAGRLGAWPLIPGIERPGHRKILGVSIDGSSVGALRTRLMEWFDPEDEASQELVVTDDDGSSNERYLRCICESLRPYGSGNDINPLLYIALLAVHGDVRWRAKTADSESWNITASGDTKNISNGGDDDAYPILKIKPTSGRTGGYSYKRWIPVRWRVSTSATKYPLDICNDSFDTQTLVGAGKMQADGDDLRVWVDGVEVDRWLDGINTATTKVWVNLDFQAKQEATLEAAIGVGDTVETIDVNEDISGFPSSGILMINSEAFVYTSKSDALRRFTGVTPAAKGTAKGSHSAGDTAWWVQHDVWVLYGNGSATTPSVDADYEPAFELDHSTNASWVYEEFGENDGLRPASWVQEILDDTPTFYTANRTTDADPWEELGITTGGGIAQDDGRLYLYNPCGITNANFTNGEKYKDGVPAWVAYIQSKVSTSWLTEYSIPEPSSSGVWESWSRNEALQSGALYVGLRHHSLGILENHLEAADCTLTLNSSNTPTITIGSEQSNYSLSCKITNTITGDAIELEFTMGLNEELEVDTDAKTVTYLADDSRQMQALTLTGGPRRHWLKLVPGTNPLKFEDTGTGNVTVSIGFEKRYYD